MAKRKPVRPIATGPRKNGPGKIFRHPSVRCAQCRGDYFYAEGRPPTLLRCAACKLGLLDEFWDSELFGLW